MRDLGCRVDRLIPAPLVRANLQLITRCSYIDVHHTNLSCDDEWVVYGNFRMGWRNGMVSTARSGVWWDGLPRILIEHFIC